ncbi:MAG TPA: amidase [Caulobacteraceae bacterium]|jgi:amidase|nr:amidase [Caulobacteraceae bacterium]
MNQSDYLAQDAVGLAALIAARQVSAAEVVEAALTRLEAVNPRLNAVTLELGEQALAEVNHGDPAGVLGGVPYLIKDLGAQVAGTPTTAGSRILGTAPAVADSAIVTAYRKAGLVIIGKTNTPEFGLEPVTEPTRFGPSRNPWELERTPGGSSGGASAAVAGGITPAAHASDGGGSIRIPAACCGLVGMKPSRGRVSFAPADEGWGGFSIQHAVSWTVRDSATLLDAVSTPQPGDPYWRDPPQRSFAKEVGAEPGVLRIAFTTAALAAPAIEPQCAAAVREIARLCESLGHQVEEAQLPGDYAAAGAAAGTVIAASVAAMLETEGARRGRPVSEDEVEAVTWATYQRGRGVSGAAYVQALQGAHAYGRVVAEFFERFDVLLLSTLGSPAIPIGALRGVPPKEYAERLFAFMPNTQAFNMTGQPAISLPLATSAEGLPIGLQFVGRTGDEGLLYRLAGQLEQARPWAERRPML